MEKNSMVVRLLYGNAIGRFCWKIILKTRVDKLAVLFLRSRFSKPLIPFYIRKHQIPMKEFEGQQFHSFREFFARRRRKNEYDENPTHLISPCDGYLSVYPVEKDSTFIIKGFRYQMSDLLGEECLEAQYAGGDCLIFRLCASDYHHYCYIDNGYHGKNRYTPGELHSVQPLACEKFPVYKRNRRTRTLLETENFGKVLQVEVGAFVVGGIVNLHEHYAFKKGREKGYFDLAGSTIVLFFEKGKMELLPEIRKAVSHEKEMRVKMGMWIGEKC